ncbi:MAG: saccharopine dehydrogenase NADP-binding domain-containing protein [Candidatus Obscuribacterales bacterium]|nr:saccharopine dehydrogenase NADP-binding domain-containing protein [Candidatus Obscuribacterales bacterium]
MNYLVLGANQFGYAVVYDLVRSPKIDEIFWADADVDSLHRAMEHFVDKRIVPCALDISQLNDIKGLMSRSDVVISCLSPRHNYELAKLALEAGCDYCDLGGDEEELRKQFLLDEVAKNAGVAIIPGAGLAPGMVSILAATAMQEMDVYQVRFLVGALPVESNVELSQTPIISSERLINEFVEESTLIRDGKMLRLPSVTEVESIEFPQPFGHLEAFNTSGGMSRLAWTMAGKIQNLDFKMLHYPGYSSQVRLLRDLGLFSDSEMKVDGVSIAPRALLDKLIEKHAPTEPDVVLIRVTINGLRNDKPVEMVWECMDYMDQGAGILAAARMNAFPLSIVAQMMARGDIEEKGVLAQEIHVPVKLYLTELASRGINLSMIETEEGTDTLGGKTPKNKSGKSKGQ